MGKINHNRPSLRYIDNLRREFSRQHRPSQSWLDKDRLDALGISLAQDQNLPDYIESFGRLEKRQQEIAGYLFEVFQC